MTRAVVHCDDSWADLEGLSAFERQPVEEVLIGWVRSGPPRGRVRNVGGISLFEFHVDPGIALTFLADDPQHLVRILRIRRMT